MTEGDIEAASAGPANERPRARCQPPGLARHSRASVTPDRGVRNPETLQQPQCLREITGRHLDGVAAGPQLLDHRPHHEHVRRVGQVDPDAHGRDPSRCERGHARAGGTRGRCEAREGPATPDGCPFHRYAWALLLLTFASLTEPLVRLATQLISDLGLAGVALLSVATGVIGLPGTEPTMLFAGFDVYQGNLSLAGVITAGVAGDMAGASIAYAIGYFGSRELVTRGGKLHVSERKLDKAHGWFERWGDPTIFFSRMAPVVRVAFPYAAGIAKMPFWRFFVLATLGSIVWISGLAVLGREVGSQWQSWRHHLEYVDYAGLAVIVAAIVYYIYRRRTQRQRSGEPAADVVPD